jgi:hypothetical protein
VLDDDSGKDFGVLRQPGQRFFLAPEKVEPYRPSVLVAAAPRGEKPARYT